MPAFETLKLARNHARPGAVFALARVPGSGRCYLGGSDFKVHFADLDAEKPDFTEIGGHTSYVTGIAVAGAAVVSGAYDGTLVWWDVEKRSPVRTVAAHTKWVRGVAASPDGRYVVSVADDMVARVWDTATGERRHELRGHAAITPHHFSSMLYAVAISPDGAHIATGDKLGHVAIWDAASGRQVAAVEAPEMYTWDPTARRHSIGGIRSLAFSPDGTRLAVGGMGKVGNIDHLEGKARVEVFDWRAGKRTQLLAGDPFKGLAEALLFLPGGEVLLTVGGANDGFVMAFDLTTGKPLRQEKAPTHLYAAALSDDAGRLYAAGHGRIVVYDLKG